MFCLSLMPSRWTDEKALYFRIQGSTAHIHAIPSYRAIKSVSIPETIKPDLRNNSELLSTPHPLSSGPDGNEFHAPIVRKRRKASGSAQALHGRVGWRVGKVLDCKLSGHISRCQSYIDYAHMRSKGAVRRGSVRTD